MGVQIHENAVPMSVLKDIKYIPPKESYRRRKKTGKKFNISLGQLEVLALRYCLSDEEKALIKAVDIDGIGFAHLADALGCSRQNISQKYTTLYYKCQHL